MQIHEGMFVKHTCLAQTSSCVIRILLMVVVMFIVTFFYSVTGFTFPFLRCVLDDPDTDFLKGKGEPSLPVCFRIYVLSL